jgi:hypothetical protein
MIHTLHTLLTDLFLNSPQIYINPPNRPASRILYPKFGFDTQTFDFLFYASRILEGIRGKGWRVSEVDITAFFSFGILRGRGRLLLFDEG